MKDTIIDGTIYNFVEGALFRFLFILKIALLMDGNEALHTYFGLFRFLTSFYTVK
jgi:hypothetical protein